MKQEIGLLVVFLLVFLYDTFMPRGAQKGLPAFTTVLMLLLTLGGFCSYCLAPCCETSAFAGMYVTSPVMAAIKNILNVGVVIVLIQSIKWANSEAMTMRRGEFYELLLVTLFGMYLMISAVTSCSSSSVLRAHRCLSQLWSPSTRTATKATRPPSSISSPQYSRRPSS